MMQQNIQGMSLQVMQILKDIKFTRAAMVVILGEMLKI